MAALIQKIVDAKSIASDMQTFFRDRFNKIRGKPNAAELSSQFIYLGVRFRFRFNSIVARRLKITKFAANRAKNIKVKYNRQQENTILPYSRLQCSPVGLF